MLNQEAREPVAMHDTINRETRSARCYLFSETTTTDPATAKQALPLNTSW